MMDETPDAGRSQMYAEMQSVQNGAASLLQMRADKRKDREDNEKEMQVAGSRALDSAAADQTPDPLKRSRRAILS